MNGEKRSSYRPPADNNWINFAENWLCFDALVADWWSPAFFAYLSFVFYLLLADLSMVPFWAPLIKQLFNKRERQLHSLCRDSPLSLVGNVGMNINEDSHARTHTHTFILKGFVVLICSRLCLSMWSNSNFYTFEKIYQHHLVTDLLIQIMFAYHVKLSNQSFQPN